MLDFHPLQLEDLPKLRNFFQYSGSRVCDTTPVPSLSGGTCTRRSGRYMTAPSILRWTTLV